MNLRSQVARAGVTVAGYIFLHLKRVAETDIEKERRPNKLLSVSLTLHAIAALNCVGRPSFPPSKDDSESAGHNATRHVHCSARELATESPRQSCPDPHNVYTTQDFKILPTHPRSQWQKQSH
jgi:hypothetical protein